jgi:hypothetical protein
MSKFKAANLQEMYDFSTDAIEAIVKSTQKKKILKAFTDLECIATGQCLCDLCPTWGSNQGPTFELARCAIPTRAFQRIKHAHIKTKRWDAYVKGAYASLFKTVFEDISTLDKEIHDEDTEAAANCGLKPKRWFSWT